MKPWRFLAALMIPLSSPDGWEHLSYERLAKNQVSFTKEGLVVEVKSSSSPLIRSLPDLPTVYGFEAQVSIEGELKAKSERFPDDFYLRLGFVTPGERRMSRWERWFAKPWVKRLYELAPPHMGIDRIAFFNLARDAQFLSKKRKVPNSRDLMEETVIAVHDRGQKPFAFRHRFEEPLRAAALWVHMDGDDTESSYLVRLHSLSLMTKPGE